MSVESRVKFNHDIAEQEQERKQYALGWHRAVVTAAEKKESKEKPEVQGVSYKMLKLTVKPIRDENDITSVVGRGQATNQCLPFPESEWAELDYDVDTKDGPVHVQKYLALNMLIFNESVRDMLAALLPDEVPNKPRKIVGSESTYTYSGEEISTDRYKECDKASKGIAGDVAERLWNDGPEELVDKACYILIQQSKKNPQWQEIKAWSSEPPIDFKTGELIPLVPAAQIMGGSATEEAADAAPATKGTNGAKGKALATKATVAQAAVNKKAASKGSKSARR